MRIVVIGSGFGGLSAAIRLQAQGHAVQIVEALDKPGGRAYVFARDGYTFDAGPTLITAPWMLDEVFALGGGRTADYVDLRRLEPYYNVRFEDGSVFRYTGDAAQVQAEVARFNAADVAGYARFMREVEEIFRTGMALIDTPFDRFSAMLKVLPDLVRLRADRSVAACVNRHITDPRLQQVFSFHPLLVGGNPFQTTAIYALIHKLEQEWGVWFAMGGTGALVRAFVRCFESLGGQLRLGTAVTAIEIAAGTRQATGVRLASGEVLAADAVVSNADVATTYKQLLPAAVRRTWTDARVDRQRYSMSLFVLYFGTTRQYPGMAHHEILMGPRYRDLLEDIFGRKVLADDFSLYLHRPTATDASLAPPGHDAWYVLAPVPHLGGSTDWATMAPRYRDAIVRYLEERYLPGLSACITSESYIDPRYFRDTLRSHLGSAFSLEPVFWQSAWFRPHNRSEDVANLYFAGAGTHPGAGLPGVISSGKIVADAIGPAVRERGS